MIRRAHRGAKVGTADPMPRINRDVAAAFAHPTHPPRLPDLIQAKETLHWTPTGRHCEIILY
jgi:hypothetical protein